MDRRIASSALLLSVAVAAARAGLSDFVRFENDAGDILKPKPPLLASRDGRFIRFDTSDTEIELELGVSVPFLKIPLHASTAQEHAEHPPDHRLTINPAGLLIGATILFTSFLLVPFVLPAEGHHTRRDEDLGFGDGGRTEKGSAWLAYEQIEQLLSANQLNPRTCSQKVVCFLGHQVASKMAGVMDSMILMEAVTKKFDIINAIKTGTCNSLYKDCRLNEKSMKELPKLLGLS